MSQRKPTAYCVLDDGETFTGAYGSLILIQNCSNRKLPKATLDDLQDGRIRSLWEDIQQRKVDGEIVEIRGLLELKRLVGKMRDSDFLGTKGGTLTPKAKALIDFFVNNLGED